MTRVIRSVSRPGRRPPVWSSLPGPGRTRVGCTCAGGEPVLVRHRLRVLPPLSIVTDASAAGASEAKLKSGSRYDAVIEFLEAGRQQGGEPRLVPDLIVGREEQSAARNRRQCGWGEQLP